LAIPPEAPLGTTVTSYVVTLGSILLDYIRVIKMTSTDTIRTIFHSFSKIVEKIIGYTFLLW
jgi:hypothetical protein